MRDWLMAFAADDAFFMPHGHCFLWIPSLLWLHVLSDLLIGTAYLGIAGLLLVLVRQLRLPFGPVILAFGLFIGLCGGTHFMDVWTVWRPDYWVSGFLKAGTALASVATAIGLLAVKPRIEAFTAAARLSEERRLRLESTHAELETVYERLREADAFRSRFFANVSHELRTPLSLILGPALRLQEADNLTADQQRSLGWICDNGTLLLRQVDDLLDLARIDADRMTLDRNDVDLVPWCRTLLSHFAGTALERRLRLSLDAPERLVAHVDGALLARAVTNLLANAVKYTPDGGQVLATLTTRDGSVLLSVADEGPGVPVAQREAIFERFNRGDAEMSRRAGGTGLGLAIAKDFAELHGGRLTVGDAALGGAMFTIEVPLGVAVDPEAAMPMSAAVPVAAFPDPSSPVDAPRASHDVDRHAVAVDRPGDLPLVLVVEDNAQMRSFVAEVLADDFVVRTAVDGVEGLALIESLTPDLVISDIAMPRMDGEAMLAAIRDRREFDAMAVLMLTARSDADLRVRLLRTGAQDFLVKPLLPAELQARSRNLVAAKRAGDTLRTTLSSLSSDLEGLAREMALKNRHLAATLADVEFARNAAERASQVKSSFLGLLSHEIRTPLASILMNLELLTKDRDVGLVSNVKTKVDRLTVGARQLSALMEGLLEYTRFDKGGIEASIEAVDPFALARELVAEYRSLRALGEVDLTLVDGAASTPGATGLRTDPRLLRVLLSNLINNAIKFTVRGSVTVRVFATANDCAIEVRDTGPGIAADSMDRIFLPFEQLEPLHGKSLPGVGLGLALVRQITEALRGRIEVESVVGQGSTFCVLLPWEPATIQASGDHA